MTTCHAQTIRFPRRKGRLVAASVNGADVTSDGGIMLVRQADKRLRLTERIAAVLDDSRRQASCRHTRLSLIRQRIFSLAMGDEDLNDHQEWRHDGAVPVAVETDQELASAATLCRFEQPASREHAVALHQVLLQRFIESFPEPPQRLILDFDATDDRVHGNQEGKFYHGYYQDDCFLPLSVFCGSKPLVAYLRRSNRDPARHAGAVLALLVRALRAVWPKGEIVFRGDGGFCRHRIVSWCERNNVKVIIGLLGNSALHRLSASWTQRAAEQYKQPHQKQRLFGEFQYAAGSWHCQRWVIVKVEQMPLGANPRDIVTHLTDDPQYLYEQVYCARGDMENLIKQPQLDLFADRTSCTDWWPNQLRLLWSTFAYSLLDTIREVALEGTRLARAYVGTIRLKWLKIGAVVLPNTQRVRLLMPESCPYQSLFRYAAEYLKLKPGSSPWTPDIFVGAVLAQGVARLECA